MGLRLALRKLIFVATYLPGIYACTVDAYVMIFMLSNTFFVALSVQRILFLSRAHAQVVK